MKKLIIAGGRDFEDYEAVKIAVDEFIETYGPVSIVSGMANGADTLGVRYAKEHGAELFEYPADWERYGKSAGYIRNKDMAVNSHALIAFWDGRSKGTENMIDTMTNMGKPVWIVYYGQTKR